MAESLRRCRPLLGTLVVVEAAETDASAIERAFAAIARVHDRMSFHSATSDLARLRDARWGSRVAVAPQTVEVLSFARQLHDETEGLFDVAIGARLVATGFLPRPAELDLRSMVGTAGDIEIDGDCHVRCHRPLLIDLGGIAKGYAVDRAVISLIADGATDGVVDAGGDLRTFGETPRAVHLRSGDLTIGSGFAARELAVATSSNRHCRRRPRGMEATPHLDARRQPILAGDSVTVLARRCIVADAFTKVAMADRSLAERLLPWHEGTLLEAVPIRQAA